MAGNMKCELSSGSPQDPGFAGSYANGPRGIHSIASLDRLGSFRESINGRAFSSGASMFKGKTGDLPPISQCLTLEPITLGDQRYTPNGELRRALGYSFGSSSEDNAFGAAYSKPALVLSVDDLKRFRGTIQDGNDKARTRVKKFDDSLSRLTAYMRKQQINERSIGSNLLKTGAQSLRKSPDQMTQKMDDKGKIALSKRARNPVADMRLEGRVTGIPRQHMILGRDKDISKQGSLSSDSIEEKIRKLPAGGESWDKKMKRRRSVSNVISRPIDGEGEIKRCRVSSDSGVPSSDVPPFRLASSIGVGSNTKIDGTPVAPLSSARPPAKCEPEKVSLSRELGGVTKERMLQKGNNRLNLRDENHLMSPKGKASRVRAGPPTMDNPSPTFSRTVNTPEDWEQPPTANRIHLLGGVNNRKRIFSSDLSSSQVTQWVGQRPQKISRVRRTNIMSPSSNNDEALVLSEGCSAPNFGALNSSGFNGSFPAWSIASSTQRLKGKIENATSPARFSESDETGAFEHRLKERKIGNVESDEKGINGYQHVGSPGLPPKKNKLLVKEEMGDGVRRQGRSGRSSSFSRGGMSPFKEKLDSPVAVKPVRISKPGSDKNGSKSGRPPLKKYSERKGFTRLGLVSNGNSPDCTGESDDDREDLVAAAQLAGSANEHACSSPFWKKVEPLFFSGVDNVSFLKQQLKSLDEHQESPSQMFSSANIMKDVVEEENYQPRNFRFQGEKAAMSYGVEATNASDQVQDSDYCCRRGSEEGPRGTPLYQRVLSALIMDDEIEEYEITNYGRNPFISGREVAFSMEEEIFSNGDITYCRPLNTDIPSQLDLWEGDCSVMQTEAGVWPASYQSNLNGSIAPQINISIDSTSQVQYAQMSIDEKLLKELQNIGLYPDAVPDLAEGGEEVSEEILQLQRRLCQLDLKKKSCLERILKPVEDEKDAEERALEQVAMDKLVLLGHKKLLATRTATAAKLGVNKVLKHVALSFAKRTLARCRKLEDSGKSCFTTEPALRDVLLAGPPSSNNGESIKPAGLSNHNSKSEPNAPESNPRRCIIESNDTPDHLLDRGKKKEILLHDVGNSSPALKPSPLGNAPMGGAKGKRSERDRDKAAGRGERKAKSKPKQRVTHPVGPRGQVANGNFLDSSGEGKDRADLTSLPLNELDPIGLGIDNEFAGNQDLGSWLNFDEDNLQDTDTMGLETPMDDLSDLNMII